MVTGDSCAQVRLELGAYLLGAIEPAQRTVVNGHLRTCPACRAELSGLACLPPLLRRIPADTIGRLLRNDTPDTRPGPPLSTLLHRVTSIRRRRRILWYSASVPLQAASLRSFEIITGRTILVTVQAH